MKKLFLLAVLSAAPIAPISAQQMGEYFHEEQNMSATDPALMKQLPYAYYPSQNKLEVALQIDGALAAKAGWTADSTAPHTVGVRIVPLAEGSSPIEAGTLTLNEKGFARQLLSIPELADGEYAVEYQFGPETVRSPKTFKRLHFPWEKEKIADGHTVFPPFTPVAVEGNMVRVVDRSYTINKFGLFDSAVSLGRELLARPMQMILQTENGVAEWSPGSVSGSVIRLDLATFQTETSSGALKLKAQVDIEEDGCAKVTLRLAPGENGGVIQSLTLEIALKDREVPLFHYCGDNSMRNNYGGNTPRGGKIVWDTTSQPSTPVVWKAESGPDDGVIWDSTKIKQWRNEKFATYRPFVPYIWLGAEARGLAWFGESEEGYVVGDKPIQEIERKNGEVILRVRLIGEPVRLDKERTIVFGLMASPGKPIAEGWRRPVASGIGPVVCWGGYRCSSKYPDKGDYTIVDKIQEARRTGKVDEAWFDERAKHRLWPDRLLYDDPKQKYTWLTMLKHFAKRAAESGNRPAGTYFEEHATDMLLPEWEVFQDEWASVEFNRFRTDRANSGVFSATYRDFALWHANQWMSRGVSLYFDNTNMKRSYNERFGPGWRNDKGELLFGNAIWGPRQYYKRMWKLMAEWNAKGAPYPLDLTYHVTNTQTIPFNTWSSTLLDIEQQYRRPEGMDKKTTDPVIWAKVALPFPADYTRTVSLARQSGSIPLVLDPLRSGSRHTFFDVLDVRTILANWGMQRVHEIQGPNADFRPKVKELSLKYENAMKAFGYPDGTVSHNYWAEKPAITLNNQEVKWLYLTRDKAPKGLLLLQSYSPEAVKTTVSVPGAKQLVDVETREVIAVPAPSPAEITLPANYGTRMFLVSEDTDEVTETLGWVPAEEKR
jgi:hypothetical protein